jgi:acetyl-CoA carboxylase biotin carboxyl carrier protein
MEKPVKRIGVAEGSSHFEVEEIRTILEMLRENGVTEFSLERNGEKLKIRRGDASSPVVSVMTAPQAIPAPAAPLPALSPIAPSSPAPLVPAVAPIVEVRVAPGAGTMPGLHEIRSPMVGTFYRRPAVDADPYVEIGDIVKKGDILCIVEAMKLMNEIESDFAGRIVEICLEDGQMAEYGEVLFRIEPLK